MGDINYHRWTIVGTETDIANANPFSFEIYGKNIAICRDDAGQIYAIDNICTHAHALLTDGFLEDGTIECPLHGGCFDIRTGKALCAPVTEDLQIYPVRIEGDEIVVDLGP